MAFDIPIAVVVFNRPDVTRKQFELLRSLQPKELLVISDAAREGRNEEEKVAAVRAVFDEVDWDCKVYRDFAEKNMGCDKREPSGISWVFRNVEKAVILEDDSMPDMTFFSYCREMLNRYEENENIMMVCGVRFIEELKFRDSYDFVYRGNTTGAWATWRRAWKYYEKYDGNWDKIWKEIKEKNLYRGLFPKPQIKGFEKEIDAHFEKGIYPWDYLWHIATFLHRGLCILPNVNLVENIGFTEDATHTTERLFFFPERAYAMEMPMKHPDQIKRNSEYEKIFFKRVLNRPLHRRILSKLKKMLCRS